ncbi:MAG: hypothetical protein GY757_18845 [bacterium]|nr:hypothetical protein [bacterium]
MSDANLAGVAFVEEVTWGTDPGVGTKRADIGIVSTSLNKNIANVESKTITDDRQTADLIQTGSDVSGGVSAELSYSDYDEWIQGALWASAWTTNPAQKALSDVTVADTAGVYTYATAAGDFTDSTNWSTGMWVLVAGFTETVNNGWKQIVSVVAATLTVTSDTTIVNEASGDSVTFTPPDGFVRNGVTENSYAIELAYTDITQFIQYTGCVINRMDISVAANDFMSVDFDFVGKDAEIAGATHGDGANTAVSGNDVINAVSNIGGINLNQATPAACLIQRVNFSINNNVRGKQSIGQVGNCDVGVGKCQVTGGMDLFFQDDTYFAIYLAGTAFSFSFRATDTDGNIYIFDFPNCKFATDSAGQIGGENSDIMENTTWQAIKHATYDYTVQVSRIDA